MFIIISVISINIIIIIIITIVIIISIYVSAAQKPQLIERGSAPAERALTVDFRNFIVFFWAETLAHWNPTSRQKNIHN